MTMPYLNKEQCQFLEDMAGGMGPMRHDVDHALMWIGVNSSEIPQDSLLRNYYTHVIYHLDNRNLRKPFLEKLAKEGLVFGKRWLQRESQRAKEAECPEWMDGLCEEVMFEVGHQEFNKSVSSYNLEVPVGRKREKAAYLEVVNQLRHKDNVAFISWLRGMAKKLEIARDVLSQLGVPTEGSAVSREPVPGVENPLKLKVKMSISQISALGTEVCDVFSVEEFINSIRKVCVDPNEIEKSGNFVSYANDVVQHLFGTGKLLRWLNSVAIDRDEPKEFAAQWFKKLTGCECSEAHEAMGNEKAPLPPINGRYRKPTLPETVTIAGDLITGGLSKENFDGALRAIGQHPGTFASSNTLSSYYQGVIDQASCRGGKKADSMLVDLLHELALKEHTAAIEWLHKLYVK